MARSLIAPVALPRTKVTSERVVSLALPSKSIMRAAAVASASVGALGLAAPAAHASGIGRVFLYRTNAGVQSNCTGKNRELKDDGDVNINRFIYGLGPLHSTVNGDIQTISRKENSSTRADKQYWCYKNDYDYEYYGVKLFSRTVYQYFLCSNGAGLGNCSEFIGSKDTAWTAF
jgi:hypothetical protein